MKIIKITQNLQYDMEKEFLNKNVSNETKNKVESLIDGIDKKYENQEFDNELEAWEMELENILELEDDHDADLEPEVLDNDYMDSDVSQGGMNEDIALRFTHYSNKDQKWSWYYNRDDAYTEFIDTIKDILLMAGARNLEKYSDEYIYELAKDVGENNPKKI